MLNESAVWPEWRDHGPLTFVSSIDCGTLAAMRLDIALPRDGTLAFFYFDGQYDEAQSLVIFEDPASLEGSRVLYVPVNERAMERACPPGIEPYPRVDLVAKQVVSYPAFGHPSLIRAFQGPGGNPRTFQEHPVSADAFAEALDELETGWVHQIGGYARPVQGPVEYEVAQAALGGRADWNGPAHSEEAQRWTLLAQFDTDGEANMMWGDAGTLYWLMRPTDLDARKFGAASFTWQCS
jgi:hypothetical protein